MQVEPAKLATLAAVLLRRRRVVAADLLTPPLRWLWRLRRHNDSRAGMAALEADLIQRGLLLSAALHHHCASLPPQSLRMLGENLLQLIDAELGADADHVPLFRGFPDTVPEDTDELLRRSRLRAAAAGAGAALRAVRRGADGPSRLAVRASGLQLLLGRCRLQRLPDLPPPYRSG